MALIQAVAADTGTGLTSYTLTYPASATAGNYRCVFACNLGLLDTTDITENTGAANWTKQTTNIDDPDFVSNVPLQCWAPDAFNAAANATLDFSGVSTKSIAFYIEDDGIDTSVGFLGGILKDNSVAADPWVTGAKSFTGDVVVYEVTTTGGGDNVGFTAGAGRTAVTGTDITTGHHGNTADGDDMFVQRREVIGGGSLSASGGNPGLASANSAMFVFRKKAATSSGSSNAILLLL